MAPEGVAVNPRDELREVRGGPGSAGVKHNFDELVSNVFSGQVRLSDQAENCFGATVEHPALPGFLIELLDSQSQVVQSATTNTEGGYQFDGLLPGVYGVREHTPEGLIDGAVRATGTVTVQTISAWPGDPHAVNSEPGLPDQQNAPNGQEKTPPTRPQEAAMGSHVLQRTTTSL